MIAIIFIENSNHEYLFQLTSKEKGHVWATTGGHVSSGDDAITTIVKEVKEELGYTLDTSKLKHIHSGMGNGVIFEVFYIKEDIDETKLVLQKEEVDQVKWLSKEDLRKLTTEGLVRLSNVKVMKECKILGDIYEKNNN
jgi:8-oxo-dGTP pyrophosphatase MutT (NUDIX family)